MTPSSRETNGAKRRIWLVLLSVVCAGMYWGFSSSDSTQRPSPPAMITVQKALPPASQASKLYGMQALREATMAHEHKSAAELVIVGGKDGDHGENTELHALKAAQNTASTTLAIAHDMQHVLLMHKLRRSARNSAEPITSARPSSSHVCVVARTHDKHGPSILNPQEQPGSLRRMIESLSGSALASWQMILVLTSPSPSIVNMVDGVADKRVTIHSVLAMDDPDAVHPTIMNATDEAIHACSSHTRWLVITTGDTAYDGGFWKSVSQAPPFASLLAFDFYSQQQRPTARQCDRFSADVQVSGMPPPLCKENLLRYGHTDVRAVVFDWPRWIFENTKYATQQKQVTEEEKMFHRHEAQIVQDAVKSGWEVHWVYPRTRCFVATAPCPHLCAMHGGVWDDTGHETGQAKCLTRAEAEARVNASTQKLEMIRFNIAFDTTSFTPVEEASDKHLVWRQPSSYATINCVRDKEEPTTKEKKKRSPRSFHQSCDMIDLPVDMVKKTQKQLDALLQPPAHQNRVVWHEEVAHPVLNHQLLYVSCLGMVAALLSIALLVKSKVKPLSTKLSN